MYELFLLRIRFRTRKKFLNTHKQTNFKLDYHLYGMRIQFLFARGLSAENYNEVPLRKKNFNLQLNCIIHKFDNLGNIHHCTYWWKASVLEYSSILRSSVVCTCTCDYTRELIKNANFCTLHLICILILQYYSYWYIHEQTLNYYYKSIIIHLYVFL